MPLFRYRFERARAGAHDTLRATTRALAAAQRASGVVRMALERAAVPDASTSVDAALRTGHGVWHALLDRERWAAVRATRTRACAAAFDDARREERVARAACAAARRRFEGFERHRGRALEAFRAEEERREEAERDESRVRA